MKSNRMMGVLLIALIPAFAAAVAGQTGANPVIVGNITITVDPRVELMSTVFRLAGNDEYNMKQFKHYNDAVGEYFRPHTSHAAVQLARELREADGIGFNAPMGLAVYLRDIGTLEPRVPFAAIPEDLDRRWNPGNVNRFLPVLKKFAADSVYQGFFRAQEKTYRAALERFGAILDKFQVSPWFDDYFGARPGSRLNVILGLQNGGANYAARVTLPDGGEELYSIVGCWQEDQEGLPVFDRDVISLVVHEFCHSFTNPIVDRFAAELESAGRKIFAKVEDPMKSSAYPDWKIMMYESFVRACVLRYLDTRVGAAAMQKGLENDLKRSFVWVGRLADLLKDYEKNRKDYPSLDRFVPRIVDFFNGYADEVDRDLANLKERDSEKWERFKTEGPKIVRMTPENGAAGVDPNLTEIRIVFDRRMRTDTFALMFRPGEENQFPEETGAVHYDADQTTLIIPVKLKPGWTYKFGLNSRQAAGFMDQKGVPLYPVKIEFKTKEER